MRICLSSISRVARAIPVLGLICALFSIAIAQVEQSKSIGGGEHDTSIYGVTIGMTVPEALAAVFTSANRKPGEEKPDALRKEGKGESDIRVVYNDLPKGELQIVFAEGRFVKEVVLGYREELNADDLRLPFTSSIGSTGDTIYNTSAGRPGGESAAVLDGNTGIVEFGVQGEKKIDDFSAKRTGNIDRSQSDLLDGARYDDRYVVGFTDSQKLQRAWWRDERSDAGYSVRIYFVGKRLTAAGGKTIPSIVQKSILIKPGDEDKFRREFLR